MRRAARKTTEAAGSRGKGEALGDRRLFCMLNAAISELNARLGVSLSKSTGFLLGVPVEGARGVGFGALFTGLGAAPLWDDESGAREWERVLRLGCT